MYRLKLGLCAVGVVFLAGFFSGCGSTRGGSSSGPLPAWQVAIANTPQQFGPGGVGEYSITVSNNGTGASSGPVTTSVSLPSALTASNAPGGNGWTCTVSSASCTRSDSLAAGSNYPPITLTVNVASSASGSVTTSVTVSGGGASSNGTGQDTTSISTTAGSKINHVVIIFQENRTPDNLFQGLCIPPTGNASACVPGTTKNNQFDIQGYGFASNGTKVTLTEVPLVTSYDLGHSHGSFLNACDWNGSQCQMNGYDKIPCAPAANCPPGNPYPQYQYVKPSDVQPYLTMAQTYAFGDRMFQTNQGPSLPAHEYIMTGTSAVCEPGGSCPPLSVGGTTTSTFFVADNPSQDGRPDGTYWAGCLAPPVAIENVIDTSQSFPNSSVPTITGLLALCWEHPSLTDILDNAGLSWKYYTPSAGSIWTAPNTINHMCVPKSADGKYDDTVCSASDWTAANPNVVIEGTNAQVVTDIQNGTLANVTWVIPAGQASDHAYGNQGKGPSWVASIVNAIGQSPFWTDTAIIITWDDWGGWYDHMVPTIHSSNSYEFGLRVPLIVISPYAKAAYVSHQANDFGSILRFIESPSVFSLPEIDPAVHYADSYALGDMSDLFDFNQTPLKFTPIPAALDAHYFNNLKEEPLPPDND